LAIQLGPKHHHFQLHRDPITPSSQRPQNTIKTPSQHRHNTITTLETLDVRKKEGKKERKKERKKAQLVGRV